MLFLFNDRVVEVDLPELRLARRWRTLGCGDPHGLRARDAVDFARRIVDQAERDDSELEAETILDIAALIISKTGANAVQFVPRVTGPSEPRLSSVQSDALEAFRAAGDGRDAQRFTGAWSWSAA
ncbi:MAG: hypothetical protein AAFQ22_04680 [Pseudomonadota bacterium]